MSKYVFMKVLKNLFRNFFAIIDSFIVSNFLDNLNDIFILQLVVLTASLWVVLSTSSPNLGELEVSSKSLMDSVTEVEDG